MTNEYPSFVDSKRGRLRCWWNVKPTGDYRKTARPAASLRSNIWRLFEQRDKGGPGGLQYIGEAMPRELTGVEIDFLSMVVLGRRSGRVSSA
jgi:hypothetical protein